MIAATVLSYFYATIVSWAVHLAIMDSDSISTNFPGNIIKNLIEKATFGVTNVRSPVLINRILTLVIKVAALWAIRA